MKRAGSKVWAHTGDILGMGVYSVAQSSYRVPNTANVLRHRRNSGTSYIEKYDPSGDTWSALTLGANTSFGANGIAQFAQCGTLLAICGGRPAKLQSISGTVERLGGPAPTAAPTWGTSGTGLTGRTMGYYTFYDPTTGWESSPSPVTSLTTLSNQQLDWSALETSCAREGVTQKRLYRTQLAADGQEPYYRVATIALATTTYADTVADASLGAQGPSFNDHDPPPTDSYICIVYANRVWIASGNELWYSRPYDGNNYQLEYFSPDRVFRFPQRIMGLAYTPDFGRLLVFCPPGHGIHYIAGKSETTFEQDLFKKSEGTNFPSSICEHEDLVGYWGQNGPTVLSPGGVVTDFSEDVKEEIRQSAAKDYNGDVFIFTLWHPVHECFFWFYSATDSATGLWEDLTIGAVREWEDSTTGAVVDWEP